MAGNGPLLRLHARLVARRDALRKALSGDLDRLKEVASSGIVGDDVDAATDSANDEISSQLAEMECRELEQIEHSLQRLVQGAYGRCETCGGKIGRHRLNALPFAVTCIECQRENERIGKTRWAMSPEPSWAGVHDRSWDGTEADTGINLRDAEMRLSE